MLFIDSNGLSRDLEKGEYYIPGRVLSEIHERFWPQSIQFDELNNKMITHHRFGEDRVVIVYNLLEYKPLYHLNTAGASSAQISQNLLVLTYHKTTEVLLFKVYEIETGELLRQIDFLLPGGSLEFSVTFNDIIIIKPMHKDIIILDVSYK